MFLAGFYSFLISFSCLFYIFKPFSFIYILIFGVLWCIIKNNDKLLHQILISDILFCLKFSPIFGLMTIYYTKWCIMVYYFQVFFIKFPLFFHFFFLFSINFQVFSPYFHQIFAVNLTIFQTYFFTRFLC